MRTVYPMDFRHSEDERFFFGAPILGGVLGGVLGGLLVNPPRPNYPAPMPYPIPIQGPMPFPGPMPIGPNYIGPNYVSSPMPMPMPMPMPFPMQEPMQMPMAMPTQPGMVYPQAQPIPYNQEVQIVEVNY